MIGYIYFADRKKSFVVMLLFVGMWPYGSNAQDTTIRGLSAPVLLKEVAVSNNNKKKKMALGTSDLLTFDLILENI